MVSLLHPFTRNIMQADRYHIHTYEEANAWSYLKPIGSKIMSLQNCEIRLLIGYNCVRALIPHTIVWEPWYNIQLCESPDKTWRNSTPSWEQYGQRTDLCKNIIWITDQSFEDENNWNSTSHHIIAYEIHQSIFNSDGHGPKHVMVSLQTKIKELINQKCLN